MLLALFSFACGVIVGAFSHKWLASEAVKVAPQAAATVGVKAPAQK